MEGKVRVGAVAYLNTRPLVFGLEQGVAGDRVDLTYHVPSALAESMARHDVDVGLLPSIELARMRDLEIVPGLAIASRGPARSVLLVGRRPPAEMRRVALDPESRTSNALTRILFADSWRASPEFELGGLDVRETLKDFDGVVRIGDKALFEPLPDGVAAHDLGEAWTLATGLPFVYAIWAARPGVLDRDLYRALHESRRRGMKALDLIAEDYTWNGRRYPEVSRAYLREHIRYRLGSLETRALSAFLEAAARHGIIDRAPEIRYALGRWSACHETAAARAAASRRGS